MSGNMLSRRDFLRLSALSGGAMLLVACGAGGEGGDEIVARTDEDEVMVKDVLQYALATDEWEGDYGWVRFQLHEGKHNGDSAYYIRTDTSDEVFSQDVGLVYVPLLASAKGQGIANTLYLFDDDRPAVMALIPTDENYTSLFKITRASGDGEYDSAESVQKAADDGTLTLEETEIFVNYPLVKWTGGELPVDSELVEALGGGPLTEAIDTNRMTVTFKLHKCYPGSRYIVTDTSAVPMAPMMGIIGSAVSQKMKDVGGTDEIWVFANGLAGPGVMGFQPAIFDNNAGEPAWSPFWDHFTVKWADESNARLLTSSAEIRELISSGELELFNGVPDSHPNGFVVNCPAPIKSPNDYKAPA